MKPLLTPEFLKHELLFSHPPLVFSDPFRPNAAAHPNGDYFQKWDSLGWSPVYRLDLTGKAKGHLALRAEIANDAEDLGDAELRLAVGIPNFALAQQKSVMVDFRNYMLSTTEGVKYGANRSNMMLSNYVSQSYPGYAGLYMDSEPTKTEGAQAEDFYFYSVRPGNFPKHSRLISVEGPTVVVNYKSEPVKIKIRRSLEGSPLSSEQKWTLTQEQATLRVNSTDEIEWELELKPGDGHTWKYTYDA